MNSSWGRDQWLGRAPEERSPFPGECIMAGDDESRTGRGDDKNRRRTRRKAAADRPFDTWLQKQLHAMYDEIAGEPLPKELLGLIDRDAAKPDEKLTKVNKDALAKKK
jgi:hypothetical protein